MKQAPLDYKDLLKKFGEGHQIVVVRFSPTDAFTKNSADKRVLGRFKTHRDYIEKLFREEYNMKVVRHGHIYDYTTETPRVVKPGLIFSISDSALAPLFEVWGIVGESVAAIGET
jgi:hypothetical protein